MERLMTTDEVLNLIESATEVCDQINLTLNNGTLKVMFEAAGGGESLIGKALRFIQNVIDKLSRWLDRKLDNNYGKSEAQHKAMQDKIHELETQLNNEKTYSEDKDKIIASYEKKIQILGNILSAKDKDFEVLFKSHMKKLNETLTKLDDAAKNEANYKKKIHALQSTLEMIKKHAHIKRGSYVTNNDGMDVSKLITNKASMQQCINTIDDLLLMCKSPEKVNDDNLTKINH